MWWMWHGAVGHWVVNQTPGMHGNDVIKSTFDDVVCPDQVANWEDGTGATNQIICTEDITTTTTTTTTTTSTSTTSTNECQEIVSHNSVEGPFALGVEWEVELGLKLLSVNPDKTTNILSLQARREDNGQWQFGDHGVKTPACKF